MRRPDLNKYAPEETEKYEAFERVTEALQYLGEYNSRESKDDRLLEKADDHLNYALAVDPAYFKARYLQAMVRYLKGEREDRGERRGAISIFSGLLKEACGEPLATEIRYNLAAAYSERSDPESWQTAIGYFNEAIRLNERADASYDPEMELLARAGLLKTYAARIKARELSDNLARLKGRELSDNKDSEQIKNDAEEIEKQDKKIRKLLRPGLPLRLWRLLRFPRPQKGIHWRVADRADEITNASLGRKGRRPRRLRRDLTVKIWAVLRWALIWLLILAVFAVVAAAVVSVYLYGAIHKPL